MSRMRRTMAVLVTVLLVAGVFASPAFAQATDAETLSPYTPPEEPPEDPEDPEEPEEPEEPETPEEPEAPEEPDEDTDVGGEVEDADDVDAAPEAETTTVLGVTLARTGVDALLLGALGLLIVGLGVFLILRTRRGTTRA